MEVCLDCARPEWDDTLRKCPDCGGRLWHPVDVAGIPGNEDTDLAARLIRQGQKPWQPAPLSEYVSFERDKHAPNAALEPSSSFPI